MAWPGLFAAGVNSPAYCISTTEEVDWGTIQNVVLVMHRISCHVVWLFWTKASPCPNPAKDSSILVFHLRWYCIIIRELPKAVEAVEGMGHWQKQGQEKSYQNKHLRRRKCRTQVLQIHVGDPQHSPKQQSNVPVLCNQLQTQNSQQCMLEEHSIWDVERTFLESSLSEQMWGWGINLNLRL